MPYKKKTDVHLEINCSEMILTVILLISVSEQFKHAGGLCINYVF